MSRTWRGIVNVWDLVMENLHWAIRNGNGVRFWRDKWVSGWDCLGDSFPGQIPDGELGFSVAYYARAGEWDWNRLRRLLPDEVCGKIAMLRPPIEGPADFPCWGLTGDGQFTLKSAYWVTANEGTDPEEPDPLFAKCWKWEGRNRYLFSRS